MKITIDLGKLANLEKDADGIFLSAEGGDVLATICELEVKLKEAREKAEAILEATALKLDPKFNSIRNDKVKVYYRAYGAKFYVDEALIASTPKELYKAEVKYKVDTKAVEKWADEHKGMPTGIVEVERKSTLSFSLKRGGTTNE